MDVAVKQLDPEDLSSPGKTLHTDHGLEEGGFTVMAESHGVYSFCFSDSNTASGDDKVVTFALHVGASVPKAAATTAHILPLRRSIESLASNLGSLRSELDVILLRIERHVKTQDSTESRVWVFTLVETLALVCVSAIQVAVVRRMVDRGKQWV